MSQAVSLPIPFFPPLELRKSCLLAQASMGLSCVYLHLNLSKLNTIHIAFLSTVASLESVPYFSEWHPRCSDLISGAHSLLFLITTLHSSNHNILSSVDKPAQSFFPTGITTCHAVIISCNLTVIFPPASNLALFQSI